MENNVEQLSVPNEVQNPGQEEELKKSETTEESESAENGVEDQNEPTVTDDDSDKDDSAEKKWIGRRLERAKAKERAIADAEIAKLREEIAAIKGNTQQATTVAPAGKPQLSQYSDIEAYTEAVADWKIEQKLNQVNAVSQEQKILENYQAKAQAFAKSTPDFDVVVSQFMNDYEDVNIPELRTVVLESDVGPAIVHYLATHDTDMERILDLPSHRRLIELGKIEDKLNTATKTVPAVKKTSAPPPIKAEKGAASLKKDINDPSLTQAEYRALRLEQRKGR